MPNKIIQKRTAISGRRPTANQLSAGELAINTADGKIFALNTSTNSVVSLNTPVEADGGLISFVPAEQTWQSYGSNPLFGDNVLSGVATSNKWEWASAYNYDGNQMNLHIRELEINGFDFVVNSNPINFRGWSISSSMYTISEFNPVSYGTYFLDSGPVPVNYIDFLDEVFGEASYFFSNILAYYQPPSSLPGYTAPSWAAYNDGAYSLICSKFNNVSFRIVLEETFTINTGDFEPVDTGPWEISADFMGVKNALEGEYWSLFNS